MNERLRQLRGAVAFLLLVYWGALFIGTHIPAPIKGIQANDKLLHLGAYAGLTFLLAWVVAAMQPTLAMLLAKFAIVATYGAMDELSQLPIPGRTGDVWDWFADLSGAALGLLCYLISLALVRIFFDPGSRSAAACQE